MRRGVVIETVINRMRFDGASKDHDAASRPRRADRLHGRAGTAHAEVTKEAQRAGIAHARAKEGRYLGRKPSYTRKQFSTARDLLGQEATIAAVVKATGLSRQTVYRIKDDPAGAEKALAVWAL